MAFTPKFADLVRNAASVTGSGPVTLGAAVSGFASLTSALGSGDQFYLGRRGARHRAGLRGAAGAGRPAGRRDLSQFARAEQLGPGLYRLSGLLRGRRGTEWAAAEHIVGEPFCLFDNAAGAAIDLPAASLGAELIATAHGIGDAAPLPTAQRTVSGESLRPPSPCHLRLDKMEDTVVARWTRRSHRGWAWVDGVGVGDDPFPERYRLSITGPAGLLTSEPTTTVAAFDLAQLPGQSGDALHFAVMTIGPLALSRPTSATIIL